VRPRRALRAAQGEGHLKLRGLLRRVSVAASGAFWQLLGYDDGEQRETFDEVESFGGVGFAARPRKGAGEAIIAHIGGEGGHPVIIAHRDSSIEPALEADEAAAFNSKAIVHITKDGDIIVRAAPGRSVFIDDGQGAVPLATKEDVDNLAIYIATQLTLPVSGGTAGPVAAPTPPTAAGTGVLRGR